MSSPRVAEILAPLTTVDGRRLGDTELIDAIRALLFNQDYVYSPSTFADALLDTMTFMRQLLAERRATINIACTPEGNTALHIACRTLAPPPPHISERAFANPDLYAKHFRVRNDIVTMLLDAGANPYMVNNDGHTAVDVAPEGPCRESLVTLLKAFQAARARIVQSVAPLDASRLMKRSLGDRGFAIFSKICKHCVYYLYKGAIYLWDTRTDAEHMIYQPRDMDPMIQALENRFAGFERRKSMSVMGGRAGHGLWTSAASSPGRGAPTFDAEEGDHILKRLAALEAKVPLVSNFTITTGVEVSTRSAIPEGGAVEWILCNTGTVIGLRLNDKGVMLRQGRAPGLCRRQSQVCGSVAEYPEGFTIDTNIFHNCIIRFSRRLDASHTCCALDGLRRLVAYVVAVKRPVPNMTTEPAAHERRLEERSDSIDEHSPFGAAVGFEAAFAGGDSMRRGSLGNESTSIRMQSPKGGPKRVSFTETEVPEGAGRRQSSRVLISHHGTTADDASRSSTPMSAGPDNDRLFVSEAHGTVFRVARLNRPSNPKDAFEDVVDDLCDAHSDPFETGVFQSVDFHVPAAYGDAICVRQCGDDLFVLFCTNGVIVADATEVVGQPLVRFIDLSEKVTRNAPIRNGVATEPQRFRLVKGPARRLFVVQSDTIELFELQRAHGAGGVTAQCLLRLPADSVTPHQYTPFFHGSRDELIVAYQSPKRTEVCAFDYTTRAFQSVCKLPKPSSLRFFPPKSEGAPEKIDLPTSVFAVSDAHHALLLRYNVTMHVMSVYSWDEMLQRQEDKKIKLLVPIFCREPKAQVVRSELQVLLEKNRKPAPGLSMPCSWLVVECDTVQKLVRDATLQVRDAAEDECDMGHQRATTKRLVDGMTRVLTAAFQRLATGAGGRLVKYEPPPFVYVPSEDEDLTPAEIQAAEAAYVAQRPLHEGVWCARFDDVGDALRCALNLHRELNRSADWPAEVLALPHCATVTREYEVRNAAQRRHPNDLIDKDAAPHVEHGPRIRTLVATAETTTPTTTLLRTHRMRTDTTEMHPRLGAPVFPPIAEDGVVVVPSTLMPAIAPLLPLLTTVPPASRRLSRVEPLSGAIDKSPASIFFTPVDSLTLIVPSEFKARINR